MLLLKPLLTLSQGNVCCSYKPILTDLSNICELGITSLLLGLLQLQQLIFPLLTLSCYNAKTSWFAYMY